MAKIDLYKFVTTQYSPQNQVVKVTFRATGIGMPSEIFVIHRGIPQTIRGTDLFESVATPLTLEEYPVLPPDAESGLHIPFYRQSEITLTFHSGDEAEMHETLNYIIDDIADLVSSVNASRDMQISGRYIIHGAGNIDAQENIHIDDGTLLRLPLEWRPAGTPAVEDGLQIILSPDPSLKGWLPTTLHPDFPDTPNTARFFYNTAQDTPVSELLDVLEHANGFPLVTLDTIILSEDVVLIENGYIYWLEHEPDAMPLGKESTAPWPPSYTGNSGESASGRLLEVITAVPAE